MVPKMRIVYEAAQRALVWLGEKSENSNEALDLVEIAGRGRKYKIQNTIWDMK
jgi:hypothetical protein